MNNEKEKKIEEPISSNGNVQKFMIVELDVLRGYPGSTFKALVEEKDIQSAIETFYKRFPGSGSHIMVIPKECAVEHTGYMIPKIAIKILKRRPLIKLK